MNVDIFNTDKKYTIIYADPPWAYKYGQIKEMVEVLKVIIIQ